MAPLGTSRPATSGAAQTTRPSPATGAIASSTSAISSSLALAANARPALHSRQTAAGQRATDTASWSSAAVSGSRADAEAGPKPEPGPVFDEAFVDHRQPAQGLLESRCLAHTPPPAAKTPFHLMPRAAFILLMG